MEDAESAIRARVAELLEHLAQEPAAEAKLPFVVGYLVTRLREAAAVG